MTLGNSCVAALLAACIAPPAGAAVIETTGTWGGLDVILISPAEKITFGTPFDVGFVVDSASLPANADFVAFSSRITFSDTVDLSAAQWSYQLTSSDPGFGGTFSGAVNDAFTRVGGRFEIALADPFFVAATGGLSSFTWLDGDFNDRVEWSITNIIIAGDTNFGLVLDDGGIVGREAFGASVIVIDPPAIAVPEPGTLALFVGGLGVLGWRRAWRRT